MVDLAVTSPDSFGTSSLHELIVPSSLTQLTHEHPCFSRRRFTLRFKEYIPDSGCYENYLSCPEISLSLELFN